jgi:DNA-binding transcriptional LysR family regulator
MNIQQLEYLIAVDKYKHFGKAAQACFITQPTLSAMIQKFEDEMEVKSLIELPILLELQILVRKLLIKQK